MTLPGDEAAFAVLFERHRRELQVHCYRMLGSLHDAEDLLQETFLRAWRRRESFEGRSSFRTWLYRIATNACLDVIERRRARPAELGGGYGEIPWLQPYPDHLLEEVADTEGARTRPWSPRRRSSSPSWQLSSTCRRPSGPC